MFQTDYEKLLWIEGWHSILLTSIVNTELGYSDSHSININMKTMIRILEEVKTMENWNDIGFIMPMTLAKC